MSRGVKRFGSMREFGGHRTGGSGGKFLSGWKKHGSIEVWLHTKALPTAVYGHSMPTVVVRENKNDRSVKETHVWSKNFVCHEDEGVLGSQYFRDENGDRKKPPQRCGVCKLIDWAYHQAILFEETRDAKKPKGISFVTPMFRFVADDEFAEENLVLHVGGICNLFGSKHLNDQQKRDMAQAKIKMMGPGGAWRENIFAKCRYAMHVVDDAHPENGVQIANEASSLGDKVKDRLNEELDDNDVDITKSPYCLRWAYNEAETDLNKKYKVSVVRKKQPSPRILKLIRGPAEDLPDDLTVPFNQQTVRSMLEAHCLLPKGVVPWDEIFPTREQELKWRREDEAEAAEAKESESAEEDEDESDDSESDDDDEEEMLECDECGKPSPASAAKCPSCGMVYKVTAKDESSAPSVDDNDDDDEEVEEPKKPEPPPLKKRSAATKTEAPPEKKKRVIEGDVPF